MAHKSRLKGGPFRLNLHPSECFDGNPYKTDKPLPPAKKLEEKKHFPVAFKPSSPSKKVCIVPKRICLCCDLGGYKKIF